VRRPEWEAMIELKKRDRAAHRQLWAAHRERSWAAQAASPKWQAYLERLAVARNLKSRKLNPDCYVPLVIDA